MVPRMRDVILLLRRREDDSGESVLPWDDRNERVVRVTHARNRWSDTSTYQDWYGPRRPEWPWVDSVRLLE